MNERSFECEREKRNKNDIVNNVSKFFKWLITFDRIICIWDKILVVLFMLLYSCNVGQNGNGYTVSCIYLMMHSGILSFVNWTNSICTKVQRSVFNTRKQTREREMEFWKQIKYGHNVMCDEPKLLCQLLSLSLINYRLFLRFNCLRIQSISVLWHIHYNVVFFGSHSSFSFTLPKNHMKRIYYIDRLAG